MLDKVFGAWKEYTGNNRINFNGTIVLGEPEGEKLLELTEAEEEHLQKIVVDFAKKHQNFKASTLKTHHAFTIKLIAEDVYTAKTSFLEDFKEDLGKLLQEVTIKPEVPVNMAIPGSFSTLSTSQKFNYSNASTKAKYEITDTVPVGMVSKILCRATRMYLLILLVVVILALMETKAIH